MLRRLPALTALIEPKLHLMHSFKAFFQIVPGLAPVADRWFASLFGVARVRPCPPLGGSNWTRTCAWFFILPAAILISPHTSVYNLVILTPALMRDCRPPARSAGKSSSNGAGHLLDAARTGLSAACLVHCVAVAARPTSGPLSCGAGGVCCPLASGVVQELTDLRIDGLTNSAA